MMDLVLGHDLIFLYLLLIPNDTCICDLNVLFDYYISEHNHTLSLISDQRQLFVKAAKFKRDVP